MNGYVAIVDGGSEALAKNVRHQCNEVRYASDGASLDAEGKLGDVARALAVLVMTPATQAWLRTHDPKALKQAARALAALAERD